MTKLAKIGIIVLAICLVQWIAPTVASACPTCKDGLHEDGTAFAFAFSVLFMMGMPFLILTFWITTIVRLRAKVAETMNVNNLSSSQLAASSEQASPLI